MFKILSGHAPHKPLSTESPIVVSEDHPIGKQGNFIWSRKRREWLPNLQSQWLMIKTHDYFPCFTLNRNGNLGKPLLYTSTRLRDKQQNDI